MKRTFHFLGWAMLGGLLLSVVLVIAAVSLSGAMDGATIQINGDPWTLAELDTGHWLVAVSGIALMLLALAIVVPLAVLIPLAIAAMVLLGVLFGALLVVGGVLAIVLATVGSPLILLVLVVWSMVRLIRRGDAKDRPLSGATITR